MLEREKILQWSEIEHDLYEENGYIFVVEIDLFNIQWKLLTHKNYILF